MTKNEKTPVERVPKEKHPTGSTELLKALEDEILSLKRAVTKLLAKNKIYKKEIVKLKVKLKNLSNN